MSRGTFLPTHYGYNVFTPITIDMDGPFGYSVCQPSTVPRLFTQSQRKVSNPGIYGAVSLDMPTQDVYDSNNSVPTLATCDELEELQTYDSHNQGIASGCPKRYLGSRKMSTMPRPFSMVRKQSSAQVRRSFSVSSLDQGGHSTVVRTCDYHDSPLLYRDVCRGRCSTNGSYKHRNVTKCLSRVGSHVVTIMCTLLVIAVFLLGWKILPRYTGGLTSTHAIPDDTLIDDHIDQINNKDTSDKEVLTGKVDNTTDIKNIDEEIISNRSKQVFPRNVITYNDKKETIPRILKESKSQVTKVIEEDVRTDKPVRMPKKTIASIKTNLNTKKPENIPKNDTDTDTSTMTVGKSGKRQSKCCTQIELISTAQTYELYPSLIGTYELQNEMKNVYKMKDKQRFLSRPQGKSDTGKNTYNWGVNSRPGAKWGWIKAFKTGKCPNNISKWRYFDKNTKKWAVDRTLAVRCE